MIRKAREVFASSPYLSDATIEAIRSATTAQLQAIADHRMERLHTASELDFLKRSLNELAQRNLQGAA